MKRGMSRRTFLKTALASAVGTSLLGVGGVTYAFQVEPGWVEVRPVRLALPRLAPEFHGLRIVQVSDVHLDDWMDRDYLARAIELVNQQEPDLVALTGDYVLYEPGRFAPELVAAFRALTPREVVLAILGNHDYWTDQRVIRQVLRESGAVELSNAVYTLRRGPAVLHIAGVDDVWERHDRLDLVLEQLPAEGAAILLAHEPDFADESAATGRFDLQLSGHSHGGQVRLPLLGSPVTPYLGRKYVTGRYQVGGMIQYTNRGLGLIPPRVRLNCRPEITVFTLESPCI